MVSPYDKSGNVEEKKRLAAIAAQMVQDHMVIGLGSGSTMQKFVEMIAKRIKTENLTLHFVPASKKIAQFSEPFDLQLIAIDDVTYMDIAFDGADLVDAQHNLIKGGGGSLFRERQILDKATQKMIVVDHTKFVSDFTNQIIPIEIVPYNYKGTIDKIINLGFQGQLRGGEIPFVTDNHNFIYDAKTQSSFNVEEMYRNLKLQTGIVDIGLFVNDDFKVIR